MASARQATLTVGMSVRDAEQSVARAVASVQAQTHADWRLLVLDDGSNDRTSAIVQTLAEQDKRIELIEGGSRRGLAQRLNEVLDRTTGTFFARMDADDICHRERFARQLAFMTRNPDVQLLGSSMIILDHAGRPRGIRRAPTHHAEICAQPYSGFPLFHPTWLGRRLWFERYRYATDATRCEDQELLLRAHEQSRFANLPEPLLGYTEDRLVWRNIQTGRANYARRAIMSSWHGGHRLQPLAIALEHVGKSFVEAMALTTHNEDRLLGHRARPLAPGDVAEWERGQAALP